MRSLLITIILFCICFFVNCKKEIPPSPSQLLEDNTSSPVSKTSKSTKLIVEQETTTPPSSSSSNNIAYEALEVIDKSPSQIIEIRGFLTETHYAHTRDGYHIHLTRIINPKNVGDDEVFKRPVVFNHGLLESSTVWLINSRDVRPKAPSKICGLVDDDDDNHNADGFNGTDVLHLNGPMMLSNYGYDVWLMDMRGTDWSLQHDTLSSKDPKFWDYSLDDFALIDVPTVIDYIRRKTGSPKVGYVGHSQATFSVFGLLSIKPKYADIIEPVVAVAPVSFFDHISSVGRLLFIGTLKLTDSNKHAPFPWNAKSMRKAMAKFCKSNRQEFSCQLIAELISGAGKKTLKGYFNHLPFYTSLKVLRHFGQLITLKTNTMYDYGTKENLRLYGSFQPPSYPIDNIKSKSLCLISTKSDTLSPPKDVNRFKERLRVPLYRDIFIDRDFNHMDMIINTESAELVFKPMLEIFESFESISGSCLSRNDQVNSNDDKTVDSGEINNNNN